ncbi:uncharacterized protein LOC108151710 isoform X2 [Drosophila miranda]|uniref:uncharacterized protein LOC108151710 isoform X2 n=1 Tax=Drosophila miranda TaxID=7229 RepID=UPI0007E7620D|nr:uncharacterized protein LOC108151710 isoform X2 [Drosophila miranda]
MVGFRILSIINYQHNMRLFSVLCIVFLIIMTHFVTPEARPIPRSTQATGQEQPQLPLDVGTEDEPKLDFDNTMDARGRRMHRFRPQVPPHTPRRKLSEEDGGVSSEEPKLRVEELRGAIQINCHQPNMIRFKLIEELYCEALSLAEKDPGGTVHYRIHRMPT